MYPVVPIIHHAACKEPPWWQDARPVLSQGQAPTTLEHYESILWGARWNLSRILTDPDVRYEGSIYGYYNRLLSIIFPPVRGYKADPQYALRPTVRYLNQVSEGSNGNMHADRVADGDHEQEVKYPDFIVSKPVPVQRGNPRYRHIIAIVGIKKPGADPREALAQLVKYSAKAWGMANSLRNAGGIVPSYIFIGPMYSAVVGTTYTYCNPTSD